MLEMGLHDFTIDLLIFDKTGHQMADMRITILEKLKSSDAQLRKTRESFYIQRFNTKYKGMNKKS